MSQNWQDNCYDDDLLSVLFQTAHRLGVGNFGCMILVRGHRRKEWEFKLGGVGDRCNHSQLDFISELATMRISF